MSNSPVTVQKLGAQGQDDEEDALMAIKTLRRGGEYKGENKLWNCGTVDTPSESI